jgi:hypothetical protein
MENKPKISAKEIKTEEKRIMTYKYHYRKWLKNDWLNESKNESTRK